ncbi:MAG: outer membrane lipoprotein-sorting protein [Acidobacteria bacterium]|nr:outer membrane lipoprotein-sorting protein [Acidobacteriota bacterium]
MLISIVILLIPTFVNVSQAPDARSIMEAVYRQDTSRDATWRAVMDVYDRKGAVRRKRFNYRKLGGLGNSRTLIRFFDPAEVRGVGLLSVNQSNQSGATDRQWMYTPAIQRVRRIAAQERRQRFLGTDFTNEDMAERILDDFKYRLIGEGEVVDGRTTWKIEARPVAPDRSQYSQIYIWVPRDLPYATLVEMYDRQGQRLRILKASQMEKIAGIWVARRLEMVSTVENTRTILSIEEIKFNTGLREDIFSQQSLEKPDGSY